MHLIKRLIPPKTFCGVPYAEDLATLDTEVAIIGASHGTPYTPGKASHSANSPGAVRAALSWYSANRDIVEMAPAHPNTVNHIEVDANRGRDQCGFHEQGDQDTKPNI